MSSDNGSSNFRFEAVVPSHVKIELTRLRIMMQKRNLSEVLEQLLDVYHSTSHGDPQLWKAIKATTTRREPDVE